MFAACSLRDRGLLLCGCGILAFYRVGCWIAVPYRAICTIFFFFLCGHPAPPAAKYPILIDVAETRLNFRRSYLWWFRNLACGDLIGNNGIQNEPVDVPPGLVWGEGMVWLSVRGLQWSSNIIGESERRASFDILQVCSTLMGSGMEEKVVLRPVVIASLVFQVSLKDERCRVGRRFHLFFLILIEG